MAANAVIPLRTPQAEFWARFQREAALRVQECNAIAGETLWLTAASPESSSLFTVQSTARPDNSVECMFDFDRGMLTCKPGPAIDAGPLVFHIVDNAADALRHGSDNLTLDQALGQILDELVWADSCGSDLAEEDSEEQ
jgi:hypothetical protein